MMSFVDVRDPHTGKILFRFDPERDLIEIQKRRERLIIDLQLYREGGSMGLKAMILTQKTPEQVVEQIEIDDFVAIHHSFIGDGVKWVALPIHGYFALRDDKLLFSRSHAIRAGERVLTLAEMLKQLNIDAVPIDKQSKEE